ncbi:Protein of unknown function [Alkalispirochaeta americana]|uniref:DUF721 domain-containing protein n=1 Tax=Alkalispirochaeta americana TaxID=159291 RepID=A0A1N6QCH5_9SPIO|nr:DUF721 domain-containing protein [Alkalispirochaeta americana]SIQ14242.1 Protein of unknown function [Alkalispirochaeta americana]
MEGFNESSARDLIVRLVDSLGAKDENGIVPFVVAWPRIVGTDFAAHSRVLDVKNGSVRVGVDHPGWLQRMHLEQRKIVASIQRTFPDLGVRNLHLMVVSSLDFSTEPKGIPPGENPEPPLPEKNEDVSLQEASQEAYQEDLDSAYRDPDFMSHLKGLEEALRKRDDSR